MKKNLYLALIIIACSAMFSACKTEPNDPDEPTTIDNPTAGTDGYWCWKVITTTKSETTSDVVAWEYYWMTEAEVKAFVETMNATQDEDSDVVFTYEKSSAKDKNECNELQNGDNNNNMEDISNWKGIYEKAAPGIYMNGNELLAKGTDGSIHHIPDVTSLQTPQAMGGKPSIPNNWHAYDGKSSTYFFWMDYYNDNDGNWLTYTYEDTIFYSVQDKWDNSQLDNMIDFKGDRTTFMSFSHFTKVDDAGTFEETYAKIAKRVQACGPIVKPSNMVQQYTEHGFGKWRDDLYPADMEAKKYVFRYTGSGTVSSFEVDRVFEWGASANDPRVVWLPASCQVDDIAYVIAEYKDVSEADAKAFIDKIRTDGFYSRILTDTNAEGVMTFEADSWDYWEKQGIEFTGNGYVYPTYKILYFGETLSIEYTVAKVGSV